ncbi:hypothetical protein H1C71_002101 [Ictidomys tridecemlineatus]|nr:hypothetical protein H1C71_002101 [Ictidomys tridecemlineatus]KAG3265658.1 hypothetical protein H1C71_002101 [Ictidomys tridecemlineatus]KAG3265659.1 hypothetical protein H1C71_002101 [Ictidomys tridecemlineatus]KAG3265660.1 hypothetical protein H1C71_002101 [Ictidomys tridecemlineatus]KAG3265661.1 hypothetical protein H1C71_002101 [Ictidomys tridecemlineatus]
MSQLVLTLSSFYTQKILKSLLSYLGHLKSPSNSRFLLTMHNISDDGIQNYFSNYSTGNLGWGKLGIYVSVANDLSSTLRDKRETMHLTFNSPLDSLCQEQHISNIQEEKN